MEQVNAGIALLVASQAMPAATFAKCAHPETTVEAFKQPKRTQYASQTLPKILIRTHKNLVCLFYQPEDSASDCLACPAGQFQRFSGQVECRDCPAGFFSNTEGSANCSPCPQGTFSNSTASTSCIDCPEGSISQFGSATEAC